MEKHIVRLSYWLGMICAGVALVWRGIVALGIGVPSPETLAPGRFLYYMSFYKAAVLFLVIAVATANYSWSRGQKA